MNPKYDGVVPSRTAAGVSLALTALWQRKLLPEPELDPAKLIAEAVRKERSDAFGGGHWREGLTALTSALAAEAELNPIGRTLAHGQIVRALRQRLAAERLWRRHPEIADQRIGAPVVVLGAMRSGTTRIQRLLACDERLAHTRLYESMEPIPARLRAARTAAGLRFLTALNPRTAMIHPTGARMADEEFGLLASSFAGAHFEVQWHVPAYTRWRQAEDQRAAYAQFRRLLQTISWSRGGDTRPWVLKVPQFMEDLDALLDSFPDARLLCLNRDADAVLGSSCSLVWEQQRIQSDSACRHRVGAAWRAITLRREERAAAVRRARPEIPQLEIDYGAVSHDWRAEMRRAYDFLGMSLAPEAEAQMEAFLARSSQHHGHRYALADFGLPGSLHPAASG